MTETDRLTLRLTPHGRLALASADDAPEMDGALTRFLSSLALHGRVSASTQSQDPSALLFL